MYYSTKSHRNLSQVPKLPFTLKNQHSVHTVQSDTCILTFKIFCVQLLLYEIMSSKKMVFHCEFKSYNLPPPSKLPLIVHNYNLGLTCPLEGKKYLCVCVYLPAILVTFQRKSTRPRFRINGIQQMILSWGEELEHKVITRRVSWLVSRDFELSQTLRIRSGLKMNFNPSLSYSSCKSQMQQ